MMYCIHVYTYSTVVSGAVNRVAVKSTLTSGHKDKCLTVGRQAQAAGVKILKNRMTDSGVTTPSNQIQLEISG